MRGSDVDPVSPSRLRLRGDDIMEPPPSKMPERQSDSRGKTLVFFMNNFELVNHMAQTEWGHPRSSRSHQISIFSILPYLFSLLFKIERKHAFFFDMWGVLFDGSICIVLIRVDSMQSTMPNFKMKYKNVIFMIKMETMCQGVLCNDFMSCYFFHTLFLHDCTPLANLLFTTTFTYVL